MTLMLGSELRWAVQEKLDSLGYVLVHLDWQEPTRCVVLLRSAVGLEFWTTSVLFQRAVDAEEVSFHDVVMAIFGNVSLPACRTRVALDTTCCCGHSRHDGRQCSQAIHEVPNHPVPCLCHGDALGARQVNGDIREHELLLRAERAEAEVVRLKELLDCDRTGLAAALGDCRSAAAARWWIVAGRGSYEWNDDRYRKETGRALQEIAEIASKALAASGKLADAAFRPFRKPDAGGDASGVDDHPRFGQIAADFGSTRFNHTSGDPARIRSVCDELATLLHETYSRGRLAERRLMAESHLLWLEGKPAGTAACPPPSLNPSRSQDAAASLEVDRQLRILEGTLPVTVRASRLDEAIKRLRELLGTLASEGYREAIRLVLFEITIEDGRSLREELARLKLWLESAQNERDDLRERLANLSSWTVLL